MKALQPQSELLNPDEFEQARQARDPRFDGRFFVGVLTTGIYCRPVCPVRVPRKENVQLYRSAAAAAAAGFRPCLRCRPESSPGTPAWSGAGWRVSRALQLIEQGALDDQSVDDLAATLGIGPRQLHRLFQTHLGASPAEVAQTRRLHFAKKLLDETELPVTEICFAAGFSSVRRFNAVFRETYQRSPRELRKARASLRSGADAICLSLTYRPPYDWRAVLDYLGYRALPGVESVSETSYTRSFRLGDSLGEFQVRFLTTEPKAIVTITTDNTCHLVHIIDRIRAIFDLRADSVAIERGLADDALLRDVVPRFSGTRVPGCWDGLEVAVRAILGQQISVRAASTLVARVVQRTGQAYQGSHPVLTHAFPDAETLADADLGGLGIVGRRIEAIRQVAQLIAAGELTMDARMETTDFVERLCAVKGIGPWTAHYIAMRALNDPDACPHADLILRRAAAAPGETLSDRQMLSRAEAWRPWRAYAVLFLWRHYLSQNNLSQNKLSQKK